MANQKKQSKDEASKEKKVIKPYIYIVSGIIVVLVVCLILSSGVLFNSKAKMADSFISAVSLYTAKENKQKISIFFGDSLSEGFKQSSAEIYESELQINRIKQAILILLQGPQSKEFIQLIPEGASLKEAYLDSNSILFIDMSQEMAQNIKGGTTAEYEAVYSLVNTVFYNFPWVRGIKILINGEEKDSLAGHISLKEFFKADTAAKQPVK